MKHPLHRLACLAVLCWPALSWSGQAHPHARESAASAAAPSLHIPASIQAEHRHLHAMLAAAIGAGGRTGDTARDLEKLLGPHFRSEEQLALPLLGMLAALAGGQRPAEPGNAIAMSERLKRELPQMLREHVAIAAAVQRLRAAALAEGRQDAVQFADTLASHALQEEQVHYPGAALVGDILKCAP